ncbi:hypothetical protein PLANPX_0070 [Lacipirellula parvula]|uniref:Uncharacterized protein n=1 Tax=Lacipirellula parvula TaxID=2650471 RepID=A0A5K7X1D5_9BACT|nr:hypothetical protein PLANPX_0070 [Lacipirellula parvula]
MQDRGTDNRSETAQDGEQASGSLAVSLARREQIYRENSIHS